MTVLLGAPDLRHDGRLVWPFGEDEVTTALQLVQEARLPSGTPLAVHGVELPDWWWPAARLERAQGAALWRLAGIDMDEGPGVVLADRGADSMRREMVRALARARPLDSTAAKALYEARDGAARASDFPLGAHVMPERSDALLAARLQEGPATVVTWTHVAVGAGPAEFERLQQAIGAYHVVMVEWSDSAGAAPRRSVGLWVGQQGPPMRGQAVRPVARRLFIREGAWRYGVAFAPTL